MLNYAAIAQSLPGAIAVNASILVGYRIAGIRGAVVSVLGTVLPPLIIISLISMCYIALRTNIIVSVVLKAMQAGVAAVIFHVAIKLGGNIIRNKEYLEIVIIALAFIASYFLKINIIYIIIACALFGIIQAGRTVKKEFL